MAARDSGKGERVWYAADGSPISCLEKIKVLNQNHAELRQLCQDALEDAVLMGCDEAEVRHALHELVDSLSQPFKS
ncbi:MAG: hypothetical protein EXQ94_01725 [Alphaproteobacteria bacterium]|nr:hypothetical protein [Alphaproteobacteria bacterium]